MFWEYYLKHCCISIFDAVKAGILSNQLTLALEPEAAAVYCKEITTRRAKDADYEIALATFSPGESFILVDCGGNLSFFYRKSQVFSQATALLWVGSKENCFV